MLACCWSTGSTHCAAQLATAAFWLPRLPEQLPRLWTALPQRISNISTLRGFPNRLAFSKRDATYLLRGSALSMSASGRLLISRQATSMACSDRKGGFTALPIISSGLALLS